MYLNYFMRIIRIKGYENCMRSKNGNNHKEFSYLNNSGLNQIYFINILNLPYKKILVLRWLVNSVGYSVAQVTPRLPVRSRHGPL